MAAYLPPTVTGADIGMVTSSAYSEALTRKLSELRRKSMEVMINGSGESGKVGIKGFHGGIETTNNTKEKSMIDEKTTSDIINNDNNSIKYNKLRLANYVNNLPENELSVIVTLADLVLCAKNVKPSVTESELIHYEALGAEFNDII